MNDNKLTLNVSYLKYISFKRNYIFDHLNMLQIELFIM